MQIKVCVYPSASAGVWCYLLNIHFYSFFSVRCFRFCQNVC